MQYAWFLLIIELIMVKQRYMNIGNLSKHLVKYALLSRIRLCRNNAFFYFIFEK
jgi:hypothetical protein